jgi:hypothetical protein
MEEENELNLKELEQELHDIRQEMTFNLYPITIYKRKYGNEKNRPDATA